MFDELAKLYRIDWRIFMAGTEAWLHGRNPYGALAGEFSAGAFAYPPTALPWLALFAPLGGLGFYVWTVLELLLWWLLIRKSHRPQLLLLCWSPMILHLVEGQSTLAVVLVLWAATRAERRGWLWGLALAWALTKPQVAIAPLLWLLWQDRAAPERWRLWGGIALGTALLALSPMLRPRPVYWTLAGLGLAAVLEGPMRLDLQNGTSLILLPWILSGHLLAAWMIARGSRSTPSPAVPPAIAAEERA